MPPTGKGVAVWFRKSRSREPASAPGYPSECLALEAFGLLSTCPAPLDALASNGRYVVVAGRVMFVTSEVNHATALTGSGLPASSDTVVGYYSAIRATTAAPWRFVSIDHRLLGGNRVTPGEASAALTKQAFEASGYGDVPRAVRR